MAYNALKRIFGETKLELKLLFLFGAGLFLVIVTAFYWYGSKTAKLVYEQNRNTAQLRSRRKWWRPTLGPSIIGRFVLGTLNRPRNRLKKNGDGSNRKGKSIASSRERLSGFGHSSILAQSPLMIRWKRRSARHSVETPPKQTEYKELTNDHEYRYFEPIRARTLALRRHATLRLWAVPASMRRARLACRLPAVSLRRARPRFSRAT